MKKFSFFAIAAVGLLFAACSSNDEVVNESPVTEVGGEGFVGISIQMPSESSNVTRANDDLTNGKSDEFAVKNAYLYLFTGTSESNATFLKRYSLTNDFKKDLSENSDTPTPQEHVTLPNGTAVTSTSVSVCKIDKLELGSKKLYAYVVVNAQGGLASEPAKGMPYSDFATLELNAADNGGTLEGAIGTNGLLMTNSPISNKAGGLNAPSDETLSTLVELEPNNIKNTETEAKNAPAGCIYVERAAAKVTVTMNASGTEIDDIKDESNNKLAMSLSDVKWQIINTEPQFYNARQIEKAWDSYQSDFYTGHNNSYRFVSLYKFDPQVPSGVTHKEGYRTYFAKDIQYSEEATLDYNVAGGKIIGTETDRPWLTTNDRAFVPENTFDVAHQTRTNTTQVTLQVKFNDGNPFYTLSNDAKFYLPNRINLKLSEIATDLYNMSAWMQKAAAKASELLSKSVEVSVNAEVNSSATGSNDLGYTVSYSILDGSSVVTLTDEQKTAIENESTAENKKWSDVKAEAESEVKVSYYAGGMAYYNVRIQHYGEYETPWSANGTYITKPGTGTNGEYVINDIYGTNSTTRTKNFLGRYGVVRDNWYNLRIDGIAKLGSGEPLTVKDDPTPDDEVTDEYFVSAHVHILPWVLRIQSVSF